ncbi:F0F1 ATP synthase subunit A [Caproiciproducens galactitolivorans]|uniref:ATP synthase subunit a n=1 Tax=Caproiciproducens galactitolivorans TaxID=642589 RepID=A0ABT4BS94_9FIRM|nr:F0F1 ATP synthase subunit A [Caproiciproducens galactitolivorans]MCY1712973.1 F0F1 ATP synthase subunit A [Caproiciproducens galactitolivorans]
MGQLTEDLMRQLNCETVFMIPILGGIKVTESVVVTWIIMAILVVMSILLTRNLKIENIGERQLIIETVVGGLQNMLEGIIGEKGKKYVPYLATVILYIGFANIIGLFGFKPPTKDLNVTVGLAIMSILLIEWAGIRKKGTKNWLKSFAEPVAIIAPINILEVFIRPLSLCMRLFGNVLGAFVVMELLKIIMPPVLPVPFSLYFDIFDGLIQAYVFVFLTSLFIKEAMD